VEKECYCDLIIKNLQKLICIDSPSIILYLILIIPPPLPPSLPPSLPSLHTLGSVIVQFTNRLAGIQGQASPQPMVTTASKGAKPLTSSRLLESCADKSYPISFMAAMAWIRRREGREEEGE